MNKRHIVLFFTLFVSCFSVQAQWIQVGDDIDGEAAFDTSGGAVSLSANGSIVAIGARANDGNGDAAGHVRIYENTNGVWSQIGQDIDGENEGDQSGFRLSLNAEGSIVAIGAYTNNGVNGISSGHVRVFENVGGVWTQVGDDIDGEAADDGSGKAVSLSADGSIVAIGASANDNANGNFAGHVRVYENIGGVWTQIGQDIDGEAENDFSGHSVALNADGSVVAIGAILNDGGANIGGQVRVYENVGGTWLQIGDDMDGDQSGDEFGFSVSLSDDGMIMASGAINGFGYVRVFENQGGAWTQIGQDIDGAQNLSWFGISVSLNSSGEVLAIGARDFDGSSGSKSGQVRVYRNNQGSWEQEGLSIDGDMAFDGSGVSVSLSSNGAILAIGAAGNDDSGSGAGQTRVFLNTVLGISEFSESTTIFYPNPTNGLVHIKLKNSDFKSLTVLDITGKILLQKTVLGPENSIDLSNFLSGIYLIKLTIDDTQFTGRIIKE